MDLSIYYSNDASSWVEFFLHGGDPFWEKIEAHQSIIKPCRGSEQDQQESDWVHDSTGDLENNPVDQISKPVWFTLLHQHFYFWNI